MRRASSLDKRWAMCPQTAYHEYFAPDHHLHPPPTSLPKPLENLNDRTYLDSIIAKVLEQLRRLQGAPAVQWQEIPHRLEPGELERAVKVELQNARRVDGTSPMSSSHSSLVSQTDAPLGSDKLLPRIITEHSVGQQDVLLFANILFVCIAWLVEEGLPREHQFAQPHPDHLLP